jgi:hypothetical protein
MHYVGLAVLFNKYQKTSRVSRKLSLLCFKSHVISRPRHLCQKGTVDERNEDEGGVITATTHAICLKRDRLEIQSRPVRTREQCVRNIEK